jgi:hypothetical protein
VYLSAQPCEPQSARIAYVASAELHVGRTNIPYTPLFQGCLRDSEVGYRGGTRSALGAIGHAVRSYFLRSAIAIALWVSCQYYVSKGPSIFAKSFADKARKIEQFRLRAF